MINFDEYNLPKLSGVYIFKNIDSDILYIGKAKNLYKRIISYKTDKQVDWKLDALLMQSKSLQWIITNTEREALLLEAELISEQKPLFNKLLITDNPFLYIVFYNKKDLPIIEVTRNHTLKADLIIGPFLVKKEVYHLYECIMSFFNLFICKKKIAHGCLHYHINKCAGFCKKNFDISSYKKRYTLAKTAIKNKNDFIDLLHKEINNAKKIFDFDELEKLLLYESSYNDLFYTIEKDTDTTLNIESILLDITIEEVTLHQALLSLQKLLHLENIPYSIDCIDISHFQGHCVTGACVRFLNGKFDKKNSKAYKLPFDQNNDYENLIILIKNHYSTIDLYPDILLIDGGKGQWNTVKKLNLGIPLLALAKKEEYLFTQYTDLGIPITPKESYGKLLLSLRNATHNAAIRLHKKLFSDISLHK